MNLRRVTDHAGGLAWRSATVALDGNWLLVGPSAEAFCVPRDRQEKYGLYFECLGSELLDKPETAEHTNFRNAGLNLR